MPCILSVSYTHLDVYKRQGINASGKTSVLKVISLALNIVKNDPINHVEAKSILCGAKNVTTVSYTHLARTIQNYELGSRKPSNMVTIQKIADALNTTTEYLLGSSGTYVVEAHEKGGAKAAKDIEELVSEVTGMFAGGELSEDAIEGAYKALTDAYWIAKENNKKYAPKTRRKKSDQ